MSDERWIVVPNWDRFQHYKDRQPGWIKLYVEVLDNPAITELPLATFGLLVKIWAAYARKNGRLTVKELHRTCAVRDKNAHLKALNDAGLIRLSSSAPLALRALAREEKRREEQHAPERARKPKPKQPAETRTNAAAYQPFADPPPEVVEVDQATLELARKWLRPQ